MLIDRRQSQLMVIDVQSQLVPHVEGSAEVVHNCARLATYARRLEVPMTLTEHYPKGLGSTAETVVIAAGNDTPVLPKIAFSCWRDEAIRSRMEGLVRSGREHVVVAGMEAHVCVGQTVLSLLEAGLRVLVVADAVGSRSGAVRDLALARLARAGAEIVSHEMVAFEWLERGDSEDFKALIRTIK